MKLNKNLRFGANLLLLSYLANGCVSSNTLSSRTNSSSSDSSRCELKGKNVSGETILLPINWNGSVKPYNSNSWVTGSALTSVPEIDGDVSADLKAVVNDRDTIDAYLVQAPLNRILNFYKLTNPNLEDSVWINEFSPREVRDSLFSKGICGRKQDFKRLKDGVYGCFYVAANKQASVPMLFSIKRDSSQTENTVQDNSIAQDSIQAGTDSSRMLQDSSRVAQSGRDSIQVRRDNLDELIYQPLSLGIGYDFSNGLFSVNGQYNISDFIIGLEFGKSRRSFTNPDKIVLTPRDSITGFVGEGIEKSSESQEINDYSLVLGYKKGLFSFLINPGIENSRTYKTKEIEEHLRNNTNSIVASNKDSYLDVLKKNKFRTGIGLNFDVGKVELGLRGKFGKNYIPNYGVRINYKL